jgi:hypothetical protein
MKSFLVILLSLALGCISAIVVPASLIILGQPVLGDSIWGSVFGLYLDAARLIEPVVWAALPWPQMFPRRRCSGCVRVRDRRGSHVVGLTIFCFVVSRNSRLESQ